MCSCVSASVRLRVRVHVVCVCVSVSPSPSPSLPSPFHLTQVLTASAEAAMQLDKALGSDMGALLEKINVELQKQGLVSLLIVTSHFLSFKIHVELQKQGLVSLLIVTCRSRSTSSSRCKVSFFRVCLHLSLTVLRSEGRGRGRGGGGAGVQDRR